ncbi:MULTISPECIES: hypothetical protein [Pseudomonas]|uniref:hypothetical protein n=1 Tax=Pseudomonas TaxID=286 RepID=UPI0015A05DB1|nr:MULTISPECIES: hypothetical protein [Pseudomonas]NVZ88137.1 hypothetical protein [Pseudomonas yamanorum]NWD85711.1 hypothetical protein [Pseudomonas sp. K5002]
MNNKPDSTTREALDLAATAEVVAGPWPNYSNCRHLPERDRWEVYAMAKASRGALEDRGVVMTESYDAFIARVTRELDI